MDFSLRDKAHSLKSLGTTIPSQIRNVVATMILGFAAAEVDGLGGQAAGTQHGAGGEQEFVDFHEEFRCLSLVAFVAEPVERCGIRFLPA